MPYLLIDDLRGPDGALTQLTTEEGTPNEAQDVLLQSCIDDAQASINLYLGFTLSAAAVGTQVRRGDGTAYLAVPYFTPGSVTAVTTLTGYTVPSYVEENGLLVTTDANGVMYPYANPSYYWYASYNPFATGAGVWGRGVPYTVAATFGASAEDLLVLRRATIEGAVRLWKYRDAGGSTVQGTEAAVVLVKNDWSPETRGNLERLKQKYAPTIGVW